MLPDQPQSNISREMANLAAFAPNDYKSIDVLKMFVLPLTKKYHVLPAVPWKSYNVCDC